VRQIRSEVAEDQLPQTESRVDTLPRRDCTDAYRDIFLGEPIGRLNVRLNERTVIIETGNSLEL